MLSSKTNALLTHTLASFWRKQSCISITMWKQGSYYHRDLSLAPKTPTNSLLLISGLFQVNIQGISVYGNKHRADSRLAPSQWETSLQRNAVSHWLGVNLESALIQYRRSPFTVSQHSPQRRAICLLFRAVQDWQWPLKNGWNSHQSHDPTLHCSLPSMHCIYSFYIYTSKSQKGGHQPITNHVSYPGSYPIDSPTPTMLRPCSSLGIQCHQSRDYLPIDRKVKPVNRALGE